MSPSSSHLVELEVTEGLERLARAEVSARMGVSTSAIEQGTGWLRFPVTSEGSLARLRLAESAFRVETFAVPRPKALLGDAHFKRLRAAIGDVMARYPAHSESFYIAAAGSDSSVIRRLREELAAATGLRDGGDEGDLQVRLLRARQIDGWDVLLRLTPRPLSARAWRVCSFPGALNATVASAMAQLTLPKPSDCFVNLMSGSGSILIERMVLGPAARAVGVEYDPERITCAHTNAQAARLGAGLSWLDADAGAVPLAEATVDALSADLPFGQRIGRHADNVRLYPAVLAEATRIAKVGARFAVLTHEVNLMERLLREGHAWRTVQVLRLNLRGLHPRLYVLERI